VTLIVHRCQIPGCGHPDWWADIGRAACPTRGGLPTAPAFRRTTCDHEQRPCHPDRECEFGPPELQAEWRSSDNTPYLELRTPGTFVNRNAARFVTCDGDDCRRFYAEQTGQPLDIPEIADAPF